MHSPPVVADTSSVPPLRCRARQFPRVRACRWWSASSWGLVRATHTRRRTAALGRPMLGHLDPEFLTLLDETCDRLRAVFRTANELTLPISGTGSAGMEAAFVNVLGPRRHGRRRRERLVRRAHVRRRGAVRRAGGPRRRAVGHAAGPGRACRRARRSQGHRGGACRDVDRRAQRRGGGRRAQGRRAPAGGLRDVARWYRCRYRRMAGRHRVQRHAEVPRRPAGVVAVHHE